MSWRELLRAKTSNSLPTPQYTHKTHKSGQNPNSADCAISAEEESELLEVLATACRDQSVTPQELRNLLDNDDINQWHLGNITQETLNAIASSLAERKEMDKGIKPKNYTQQANCKNCGPIWLWRKGEVLGCPWCWNSSLGNPIPRPHSVQCGNCIHFKRIKHPNLGHCTQGEPEAIAGLWDSDQRNCLKYLPKPPKQGP